MRQSSLSMMTLNSLSETPSVRNASVGTGTRQKLESLTAVEKDALGKFVHLCPVLLKHILVVHSAIAVLLIAAQVRTTHIFSMPSMSSCGDICTPILETYFAPVLSTLPTTEVNDGRHLAPGGGWVMSAPDKQIGCLVTCRRMRILPMIIAGFTESVRKDMSCGSATALVPPSFTLILNSCRVGGINDYHDVPTSV